jgi:hypothetical protein
MAPHGHGDGAYAHYTTNMWPEDLNFIKLSLLRCLRALKKPIVQNSKKLFDEPPLNDYFEKIMGKIQVSFFFSF